MFISSTGDMRPVQLDQIESVEEHAGIMPALSDTTAQGRRTGEALQPPRQRADRDRFSLIVEALARLRSRSRIIDGEAVACERGTFAAGHLTPRPGGQPFGLYP